MIDIKRIFDFSLAGICVVAIVPLLLALMLLVKIKIGGPVLFKQQRPGLGGKPFTLLKFRTMTDEKNGFGNLLNDAERLTQIGRFMRATSLDELPEIFNILAGDMSFVGPRPLLMRYLERYTPEQARRHEVKPGLSGWAQVNGRNAISWNEKFKLDIWYVDNRSISLDLKIILMTIKKVLRQEGISHRQDVTMPEFFNIEKEPT
jgi:sugar transferase EpsL